MLNEKRGGFLYCPDPKCLPSLRVKSALFSCDECKYHNLSEKNKKCDKNHKPRFYENGWNFGYKKRCSDFAGLFKLV